MGRMYRAVQLKNNGHVEMIVAFIDTGSDGCVISKRIADRLHLDTIEGEGIEVANREVIETEISKVTIISPKDRIEIEMTVDVTDIPFIDNIDENIDMIIGVDFLQRNKIKLVFCG